MTQDPYLSLLSQARRITRCPAEAEDLLQTVLLAAVEKGRHDLSQPHNRRWLRGALTKRAAFEARSAIRRRAREARFDALHTTDTTPTAQTRAFLDSLPPSLRSLALMALTGHTRAEIAYLLRLPDTALRQRIAQLRKRWVAQGAGLPETLLRGALPFGLIRRALRDGLHRIPAPLASHDPDGHLFLLGNAHKRQGGGNPWVQIISKERPHVRQL